MYKRHPTQNSYTAISKKVVGKQARKIGMYSSLVKEREKKEKGNGLL